MRPIAFSLTMGGNIMKEATLNQYFNDELEELVVPASVSGIFPLYIAEGKSLKLKVIRQEGFDGTPDSAPTISVYTSNQIKPVNIEEFYLNTNFYGQGRHKLRIAKVATINNGNYDFYQCGDLVERTDIYTGKEDSSSILGKIKSYWSQKIVFHGNDGNIVRYNGSEWVVEAKMGGGINA